MESDEIYATEEIIDVTEKVVEDILTANGSIYWQADWYNKGPLSWFLYFSKRFNPRGKFAIDIEALTVKQKTIVIDLVGQAIPKLGSKHKDVCFQMPDSLLKEKNPRRDSGYSPSEWREIQIQGRVDTIIRAINSK